MKVLIVVDMQNDFVDGSLGSKDAMSIIPNVFSKIEEYVHYGNWKPAENDKAVFGAPLNDESSCIIFTQDTHYMRDYINTEEGKNLPVLHCLKDGNDNGWNLIPELDYFKIYGKSFNTIRKETFGSDALISYLQEIDDEYNIESVELIGLCTDMCVISNAIIAKAALPNVPIYVDASCCAGSNREQHHKAIGLMEQSLHIHVMNKCNEPWRI